VNSRRIIEDICDKYTLTTDSNRLIYISKGDLWYRDIENTAVSPPFVNSRRIIVTIATAITDNVMIIGKVLMRFSDDFVKEICGIVILKIKTTNHIK